jgi:hypothetical protein
MSTALPLRCPCGCGKFDHDAYQPVSPCTFSAPAPRHQPGQSVSNCDIRPWLAMWDTGWSIEKIADAWNETPETVEAALDIASQQPLPLPRSLPRYPRRKPSAPNGDAAYEP